jgi:hypothetical protein
MDFKKIEEDIDNLNNITDFEKKTSNIVKIMDKLNEHTKQLNTLNEKFNDNIIDKKYSNYTIDELNKMFINEKDISKQIDIYKCMTIKIKKLQEKLFKN